VVWRTDQEAKVLVLNEHCRTDGRTRRISAAPAAALRCRGPHTREAACAESRNLACVTQPVPFEFFRPIAAVRFGVGRKPAPIVRVPEAPMHKDRPPAVLVRKIGIAGKTGDMLPEAETESVNGGSCKNLGFRIARSDPRHHLGARQRRALPAGQNARCRGFCSPGRLGTVNTTVEKSAPSRPSGLTLPPASRQSVPLSGPASSP